MGTSVSQYSPRSSKKWSPVHVCYTNDNIPEDRVLTEVWRAADNPSEQVQWSKEMKSDVIYSCFETVKSSSDIKEAMSKFKENILSNKSNSIVAEFAKRSIPSAFQGTNPARDWVNKFFSEVTNYVVSRDTSGFVGEKYRNKTVKDLDGFKKRLSDNLHQILQSQQRDIKSQKDWSAFIDSTVAQIKSRK
ncbi:hypothetical protein [Cyclobacterium plantarum]|uniref:hypothetical protein n=1 Tax=Cyclobacterium plantarum TaxID=2716263 RepID=UPI003F70D210